METLHIDGDPKKEFDDSGVQDVDKQTELEDRPPGLLDLSDDVLLCILKFCCPRDLKALGFTCPRLGRLIRDRTLWTRVDARSQRTGRARMRWLLAHALGANTVELKLQGYALAARGCLGHVNRKRKEVEEEKAMRKNQQTEKEPTPSTSEPPRLQEEQPLLLPEDDPLGRLQRLYAHSRYIGTPTWPEDGPAEVDPEDVVLLDGSCPGPQFTLTQCMLRQIRLHCSLTSLSLEYCNINCNTTGINHFPPTLKRLSLKGAKCYNLPLDKSFLFNIQDYLPEIEFLNLSECEWLEPASMLPLSKVAKLKHLIMRDCYRLSEFVAYASLATRYGFRKLEILDVRGSPVADSEVSAFGWLPRLQELYLSPAPRVPPHPRDHSHYRDEPLPPHKELDAWEMEEPEHFKIKPQAMEPMKPRAAMSSEEAELMREYENSLCLHGLEYNLCTEGAWYRRKTPRKCPDESSDVKTPDDVNIPTEEPSNLDSTNTESGRLIKITLRGREGFRTSTQVLPAQRRVLRDRFDEAGPSKKMKLNIEEPGCSKDSDASTSKESEAGSSKQKTEKAGSSKDSTDEGSPPKKKKTDDKSSKPGPSKKKKFSDDQKPGCSKDVGTNTSHEAGPSKKKKLDTTPKHSKHCDLAKPGCSKDVGTNTKTNDDSDTSDDDVPLKQLQNGVNEGASTSKPKAEEPANTCRCGRHQNPRDCAGANHKYEYVRFRQNMDPVLVRDPLQVEREEREERLGVNENDNREVRPRAHVLYVNVGQQLHTVYRLSIHNEPPIFYSFAGNSHLRFRPNVGNIFYTPPTPHMDATSLVSDSAVRRFGRAEIDDINVVHIGPRMEAIDPSSRPSRSSLRVLSITGFRNITDRSLMHLATAAPDLRVIDFSETRVTAQGVENFKSLRSNCEVKFSEYVEKED